MRYRFVSQIQLELTINTYMYMYEYVAYILLLKDEFKGIEHKKKKI